jgi:branched-subunit amino acid ABC-type transport system permease component
VSFITSLGVFVVIKNIIALVFGDSPLVIPGVSSKIVEFLGIRMSREQIVILGASCIALLFTGILLRWTRFGLTARAVALDPELSSIVGVHSERVLTLVFSLGSALGSLAGVLLGMDTLLIPTMGFHGLLLGVSAVILGGEGGMLGLLLASLAIGAIQHLGALVVSTRWQDSLVFLVLVMVLLARPHGIAGVATGSPK